MNIPLDEVIFFDCITTHPTTGAATDADSTPTFAVYEESTDTDIGVGGNLTKRTSLTGNYRGTFTLSAANGFEVGKWYSIIGSATVNSIAGKAVLKNFRVVAAEHTAGYPVITIKDGTGTGEINTNAGAIAVVDLVTTLTTYTGNTPQTGDVFPLASTEIADIKAKTDNLPTDPADESLIIAATDAIMARLGAPAGASVSADIALITTATNAGDLASKTADAGSITTGTNTSGSYTDTASDNDVYWITAPVTPAVGGFGLRFSLRFDLPLARIPTQLQLKGYWNGSGQTADVYALNARTGVYDKLTNTGTNLLSRTSEFTYAITLPRDYADDTAGVNNIVTIEIRTASTNTAHRMRIDRALVYHVNEVAPFTMTAPTVNDIWTAPSRTLTSPGVEPVTPPTAAEISADLLATAIADAPTQGTVAAALLAAETQGVGKWTLVGTTLTLYRRDGTTVVRTFTLDSATAPTSRT